MTRAALTAPERAALVARFSALADDELLLAHRLAEWTGHAPMLEEDIALANIAQDELGHAMSWLELRCALDGHHADRLAFLRDPDDFCNVALTELPTGDWAFTMTRQYLFDAWEALWQAEARSSRYRPLAEAAALALREERFHLEHTALWTRRLALGTPESTRRSQTALEELWPYALGLFEPLPREEAGIQTGLLPDPAALQERWTALVRRHLADCGLTVPDAQAVPRTLHTPHRAGLLAEFQAVARTQPEAVW